MNIKIDQPIPAAGYSGKEFIGLWTIDSHGKWEHFMSYNSCYLKFAIEDGRKTIGIDVWAIVRADGVVIAQSVGADVSALKAEAA